ncbi:hypothetical protein PHLCEN_2v10808 [Hermanssonia centrifuga]|uniref:Uncharacterized protein n=1 Tax=Hermanssonia centrifuga TaxID=98765 RepID=A0A2R6NMS7_9APHY|nr:hypothetical protein PHLCEN_2v10808 [Hermanssonia centrifuga]
MTVDMFAIFSLRRPDILPVGDLGVQRGLLRWFLSRHSQSYNVNISPSKLPKGPDEEPEPRKTSSKGKKKQTSSDTSPALSETEVLDSDQDEEPIAQGVSSVPPAPGLPVTPALPRKGVHNEADILPTPFTPSINKVLTMNSRVSDEILPLPEGLTVAALKTRLDTKKKIK